MTEATKTEATAAPRPQAARPQGDRPQGDRPQRPQGDRPQRRPAAGRFQRRRKFCKFCAEKNVTIDYKNPDLLRGFITERYKILPSRVTGTCSSHQRRLTTAIKRARVLALIPFTPLHHD
ncbi:30S ribosomal protein S18 [Mariprofundus ferrooxydans]|uniref:Small ribosomal subunit protein bS18 n=1 Tax=Mariprofundus ferrooxydans PV-1 TaxID=314345 RepID=Q0EY99_9PROT|nr:ribosomal protein S18 [Mariprofundus ferrooxydans PV-1]KON47835.1 30S ribosomal protein S18 [Mariprofundus ferrooxydans]